MRKGKYCPNFDTHWRLGGDICKIKNWNIYQTNVYRMSSVDTDSDK